MYRQARDILAQYIDQSFSFVDAVVFTLVNDDPAVDRILTVDGRDFSIYRFAHNVEIVVHNDRVVSGRTCYRGRRRFCSRLCTSIRVSPLWRLPGRGRVGGRRVPHQSSRPMPSAIKTTAMIGPSS
jgi:hypothetical protein